GAARGGIDGAPRGPERGRRRRDRGRPARGPRSLLRARSVRQPPGTDRGGRVTDLPFRALRPDARLPEAAHTGDAGLDLRAVEPAKVAPGERAMIPTGLSVAIPDGHAGLVLPRSGLASRHGL